MRLAPDVHHVLEELLQYARHLFGILRPVVIVVNGGAHEDLDELIAREPCLQVPAPLFLAPRRLVDGDPEQLPAVLAAPLGVARSGHLDGAHRLFVWMYVAEARLVEEEHEARVRHAMHHAAHVGVDGRVVAKDAHEHRVPDEGGTQTQSRQSKAHSEAIRGAPRVQRATGTYHRSQIFWSS